MTTLLKVVLWGLDLFVITTLLIFTYRAYKNEKEIKRYLARAEGYRDNPETDLACVGNIDSHQRSHHAHGRPLDA